MKFDLKDVNLDSLNSPQKRNTVFLAIAALAGVTAAGAGFVANYIRSEPEKLSLPAANAAVKNLFTRTFNDDSGKPIAMQNFAGKRVVLNFWAPWCAPCVEELPEFSQVANEIRAAQSPVAFVGLGIDNPTAIAKFAAEHPVSFPLLVAGVDGTAIAKSLGNTAGVLPYTVIIGADGAILQQKVGRVDAAMLRSWLKI